ncbi:MAG: hypothetical protein B6D37_10430 [Sphingobacteriales bacterium UTBCD1]|jgi:hypothetical protein|nr:MAG: hypothetical protein B6D37_10430 [Sphingobacteriales bacterium UTBCD1]
MKHKKIKNIIGTLMMISTSLALLTGCMKKLDLSPETQLSDGSFWKNISDLKQGCNYLYTFLNGIGINKYDDPTGNPSPLQDNYSDKTFGYSYGSIGIGDGSRIAKPNSVEWTNFYALIRAANNVLEKSKNVTGDINEINKYQGEAHFFRALGYFELVKRFGDVPYYNHTLTVGEDLYASRTPRQEVVDSIYADLDFAANYCPQPDAQAAADYGRITRTAALGYKSRVALFEGTWDKFRNLPTSQRNLQAAIDASGRVMSEGRHALYTSQGEKSYFYLFQYDGGPAGNPIQMGYGPTKNYTYATNKESMLVRLYGQNTNNIIAFHPFGRAFPGDGNMQPTKAMVEAYLYKDGLPPGFSPYDSLANQTSSLTEFRNRDPRFEMSVFNNTMDYITVQGGIRPYVAGRTYVSRKYFSICDYMNSKQFVNFIILRYAEVLLNNAEAKFELNDQISDGDLNQTINLLRNRATNNDINKLPLLTNSFVQANGLDMRAEIRRERTVELAFEGFAYWDILRWKTAEIVSPKEVLGRKYFVNEDLTASTPPPLSADGYVLLEAASFRSFKPQRDYLWPLPTRELALNSNLQQNPGW